MRKPFTIHYRSPKASYGRGHREFLATEVPLKVRTRRKKAVRVRGKHYLGAAVLAAVLTVVVLVWMSSGAPDQPGTLVATVNLPGNGECSVGGTFDGTYYLTIQTGCISSTLQIYQPPPGNGNATLVSTKTIVDSEIGSPVTLSAIAWDPSRRKFWGVLASAVYLIDIGDPTIGGEALASFQFHPNVSGSYMIDGLAYDVGDDTLYYVPDSNLNVYHFSLGTGTNPPLGTLMNVVTPRNAAGQADGALSGVVVGLDNTLFIGRNKNSKAEILRIHKTTGAFISRFATMADRVGDLTCDAASRAAQGTEAILAKDAFNALYQAFEVEEGTCGLRDRGDGG